MKKKALWRDVWKGIWNNKASFLALFAIIMLGTGFFGGISATGPNMLETADSYYKQTQLFDLKILSTYGIENEDMQALEDIDSITVQPTRTLDLTMAAQDYVLRLFTYDADTKINDYVIESGRLPEKPGEIALDGALIDSQQTMNLGDVVEFDTEMQAEGGLQLVKKGYTVVGFVNSPIYIEKFSRGNTQAGTGSLDGFGVIHSDDITGDLYTEIYVAFDKQLEAYTDSYKNYVAEKTEEIELALNGRPLDRINAIRSEGRQELFKAERELDDAKAQIQEAEETLSLARTELDVAWENYNDNLETFQSEIAVAENEIAEQQAVLDAGYAKYATGLAEWESGSQEYADEKAKWQVQRAALLEQMDTAITLEGLVENPIPTPEGAELAAHVKELLDAEQGIRDAQSQLESLAETFVRQEQELQQAQVELNQAYEQLTAAEAALLSQRDLLAVRQGQLTYVKEQLQKPYTELTDVDKAEMRTAIEGQGDQTLVYQPFLNYLNGTIPASAISFAEEAELQSGLTAAISERQAEIDRQKADLQATRESLVQKGIALEEAKTAYSNNLQLLETRAQELQRAKNVLLNEVQSSLQEIRDQLHEADLQFEDQAAQLAAAKVEIDRAKLELDAGQTELTAGQERLAEEKAVGEVALADAYAQIQAGEEEYAQGLATFEAQERDAQVEIQEGETALMKVRTDLLALEEPIYFVHDRTTNPGYSGYGDNADRISSIASIFPVFFFLIAALVSFTTMTRMVDEQRTQIGTLKGLGYSSFDISQKFLVYAAAAGVSGTIFGLVIGYRLFPSLIYNAYRSLYNLPDIHLLQYPGYTMIAVSVAILCTMGPAALASYRTLAEQPASIMRPKAPKIGKRVLLERVPAIWNWLGFNAKITIRNLVRYKIRNTMTIIGVAGCMALILTGFALSDSISGLAETQFNDVIKYDTVVALQPNQSRADLQSYEAIRDEYAEISGHMYTLQAGYKAENSGVNTQDVNIFVPESTEMLPNFVKLAERGEAEQHSLTEEGAIISEKLAAMMEVGPGDELVIQDDEEVTYRIPIQAVTENYTGHYLYLSRDLYEDVFAERFSPNVDLLTFDKGGEWEFEFAERAMQNENITLVTFMATINEAFNDTLKSLDVITLVLIVSAGALAFVVLYNLTNINVSERIRELSTIKVLGFYDLEVSLYIYRETFILTVLGILFGFGLGNFLAVVLLKMVEVDFMLFPITILPTSYFYSTILTLLFSVIVMVIMHTKLKRVDMIEALKSVE